MLNPRQFGRLSGRHAEYGARKGFEDQILRAVGEHRYEHEDREAARVRRRR